MCLSIHMLSHMVFFNSSSHEEEGLHDNYSPHAFNSGFWRHMSYHGAAVMPIQQNL